MALIVLRVKENVDHLPVRHLKRNADSFGF